MAVSWTEDQLRAITAKGHAVLVSAAAGSGKTAVLVERIIRAVCDENDPHDIDRFLVVTFTKAAASEMRDKISRALTEKLLENPYSRRLRTQLSKLSHAYIMTVDSFCTILLREYFQEAGISPDFRVCDENEAAAIQNEILEDLIESKYENSSQDPDFLLLVDALAAARNDNKLRSAILDCYRKLQSHPFVDRWISENICELENASTQDPADSIYGKEIISCFHDTARYYEQELEKACEIIGSDEIIKPKYLPAFTFDLENIRAVRLACETSKWDKIRDACSSAAEKKRLTPVRQYQDKALLDSLRAVRDTWHEELDKYVDGPFAHDAEKTREDCLNSIPVGRSLMETVRDFDEAYSSGKRARNVLDFSDLEHFALKILIDDYGKNGFTPSDTAREISMRFDEIAVDEFQDTNKVQDLIFRALSKQESNLFLVGDVKQSIYGFRLADPGVFLDKYHRFGKESDLTDGERIILSHNFRSRFEVVESVNYIFKNIFSPVLGGIEYSGREQLVFGASYPEKDDRENEFVILEDPGDGREKLAYEADYIASRIQEMLSQEYPVTDRISGEMRPCRPDDFAILLRSVQNRAPAYSDALKKLSIPVFTESTEDIFQTPEIMTLMSLCEVIDNPEQDISLASVLHSPVYAFSADELAGIRMFDKDASFYGAFKKASESQSGLGEKCRSVLAQFSSLRSASRDMSTERLIMRILQETDFISCFFAAYGKDFSRSSINAFISAAAKSEISGHHGLYAFLNLMHSIRDEGRGIPSPPDSGNGVRIMTIHKSKGLEFPIVFIAGLETRFNMQDLNDPVLIHPQLGAGFKYSPKGRMIEYPTLMRHAISRRMRLDQLSEQMRILYVALTRAKEKLILVAAGDSSSAVKKCFGISSASPVRYEALLQFESPVTWLFTPLLRLPCAAQIIQAADLHRAPLEEIDHCLKLTVDTPAATSESKRTSDVVSEPMPLPVDIEELYARLDFHYDDPAVNIPSKITATGLKGRYADEESRSQAADLMYSRKRTHARPRSLERQSLTPSQRGTALHMAMQFLDFSRSGSVAEINMQLSEMAEKRLLSQEAAKTVDANRLYAFFNSSLGKRLASSHKVYREFKFSLLASSLCIYDITALARTPCPDEDTILFQGVIDCFFEEDDGIVLIDFKSDRVTSLSAADACNNYSSQIRAYSYALQRITGKPVKAAYLYFFALDNGFAVE